MAAAPSCPILVEPCASACFSSLYCSILHRHRFRSICANPDVPKVKFRCNHSFLLGERVSHSYFRFQAPPMKLQHVFHFYTHFWECICGMKWGCHTLDSHRSSPETSGSLGVPETTVRFINLLEGPTELRKAVILMVTVYYSQRTQARISKGKRFMGQIQGQQAAAPSCPILAEPCAGAHFSSHGANQGRSHVPWCSEVLLGVHRVGMADCP